MTHCQACGTDNGADRVDCRLCGRRLEHSPSGDACPACSATLGVDAVFCGACGAPVPVAVGVGAAGATSIDSLSAALSGPGSSIEGEPASIGLDLELPDWIKRAAAETPFAPEAAESAPVDALLPAGFVVVSAQPAPATGAGKVDRGDADASDRLVAERPESRRSVRPDDDRLVAERSAAPSAAPKPPAPTDADRVLPPLPDGGLAASMPDWLRAAPAIEGSPSTAPSTQAAPSEDALQAIASGTPVEDQVIVPPAATPPTPADPSSFISEEDLPVWIRQLVANEAADADALQAAANSAAPAAAPSPPPSNKRGRSGDEAPTAAAPSSAAVPTWLSRNERPGGAAGRSSASGNAREAAGRPENRLEPPPSRRSRGGSGSSRRQAAAPVAPPVNPTPTAATPEPAVARASAARTPVPAPMPPAPERERNLLPVMLVVGLVLLAIVAYLLGTGILP